MDRFLDVAQLSHSGKSGVGGGGVGGGVSGQMGDAPQRGGGGWG